ncbi:MAG: MarR family transcriptional regulator [Nisaea sp.]|uniref:MarR family winged helix-turn-helix transcriptional regulator n=1 Tax=Nisaea sp. TaxID=2024842 RepID=UPI001B16149D|nr:MarR family transcriptional regulator [Nisaea sp.]MBO6560258.1 MarR family transcriptional regulator [Nisaea sp.]
MNRVVRREEIIENRIQDLSEDYADERIAHLVRLSARGFNRSLARRLADHGVSFGQWVFLRILWKEEGLTQKELSKIANLTEPTTHTALTKLKKLDVVEQRTQGGNKRKLHIYLTEKGRALQSVLEPLAVEANDVALQGISPAQHAHLHEMLVRIIANLEQDEAEAEAAGVKVPPTRSAAL